MSNSYVNKNWDRETTPVPKMTPAMKLLKVGRSKTAESDKFAKLAAPSIGVAYLEEQVEDMNILVATPKNITSCDKVILYCHGGGFKSGKSGYASNLAGKLAVHTGYVAKAHLYRLSPEHQYPAAIEDTIRMWEYLLEKYEAGNIIVAGDSAGGNLALEVCLWLKKRNMQMPGAMILMSPWTDMTLSSKSYEKYKDTDPVLSREYIEDARKGYLGERQDYANPDFSPLYGDFKSFPPVLIQVGSNEILRGDSERLAYRMKKQGVTVKIEIYKESWHVFQQMPVISTIRAFKNVRNFLESSK